MKCGWFPFTAAAGLVMYRVSFPSILRKIGNVGLRSQRNGRNAMRGVRFGLGVAWAGVAAPSARGAIVVVPFAADADSGISTANTYTHRLDFPIGSGGAATVNGVAFTDAGRNGT